MNLEIKTDVALTTSNKWNAVVKFTININWKDYSFFWKNAVDKSRRYKIFTWYNLHKEIKELEKITQGLYNNKK